MNPQMKKLSVLIFIMVIAGLAIFRATLLHGKTELLESQSQVKVKRSSLPDAIHSSNENYTTEDSHKKSVDTRRKRHYIYDCIILLTLRYLDREAVEETRTTITELMKNQTFLLNLHIAPPEHMPDAISPFLRNRMLEWKYLRKDDHLLHIIPVDFDLLTFNMLELFDQKANVNLPSFRIKDENTTCRFGDNYATDVNILAYMYHLTNYSSDFMFCTLKFDDQDYKDTLYYLTTIWVGYNMFCAEPNLKSISKPTINRKKQSVLAPLMCFLLALECVWLFKLIQIHKVHKTDNAYVQFKKHGGNRQQNNDCSSDEQEIITDAENPQRNCTYKSKCTCYYFPHERPYGVHRFLKKVFHAKITPYKCLCDMCCFHASCKQNNSISRSVFTHVINLPSFRCLTVLYIFLLLPVSVYRTIGRKILADKEYRNYKNIVRASEPMCNSISMNDDAILLCDWVYALFGSLIGVVLFIFHHYSISKDNYRIFSPSLGYQDVQATTVCDKLMSRMGILLDLLRYMSYQVQILACCRCTKSNKIPHRHEAVKLKRSQNVTITRSTRKTTRLVFKCAPFLFFLLALVEFLLQFLLCSLPIIPFSIHHFMKALCRRKCAKILSAFMLLLITILSFRPVISSFLFLLRTLTVTLFILLPVREYIFKYFMIVVSVVAYLIYYYNEVMSLLTTILTYVCALNKEKYGENCVDQHLFNHILGKLVLLKTKIYFAMSKAIVVTTYIFITIEALTIGKNMDMLEFAELTQYGLIFGSPYLLSIFFKSGKGILNDDNKKEVKRIFEESEKSCHAKQKLETHHALISSCLQGCLQNKESFESHASNVSDNIDVKTPL